MIDTLRRLSGRSLFLTALLLLSGAVTAAERADDAAVEPEAASETTASADAGADREVTEGAAASDERSATGGPSSDGPSADGPSSDVFVPSEEISEDYAVSFPVDI